MQRILAIDFDDTIVDSDYPTVIRLREGAKEYINKLYDDGFYIIIWTCRSKKHEQVAELYLLNHGIKFHKINQHHPQQLFLYEHESRKIYADVYVDDKCLTGLPDWPEIYEIITQKFEDD
jgi:hypothetical protein